MIRFASEEHKRYTLWSCQKVCDTLIFVSDIIYIRFGTKLKRPIVGIPMGTNCAPLVADLFLFCYERDFIMSLSADKEPEIIEALNSTSRYMYLDDLLNSDTTYFEDIVKQIYPSELQLNKANSSDTQVPFLDLHLTISDGFVSSKIYDKRGDFDIVNFLILNGDIPRATSYGVYISQLIRFARVSSHVADFHTRNQNLTAKVIGITNSVKHFQNSIDVTVTWYQN